MSASDRSNARRGEAFYQALLDTETRPVPPSLRETSMPDLGAVRIPPAHYVSPEFHALEIEHVWRRVWQVVCREEQIPVVGDTWLYEIGDASLVLVRTADGVKAFHNSCLHRGTQLLTVPGRVERLRCPYHGFTWSLEGVLTDMPGRWDFPDVEPDDLPLPEARVATWGGFVFVNLDPAAPPLEEYLEDLPRHFAAWPLEERHVTAHIVRVVPCNWKVALEAFIESFHVTTVHPQLMKTAADSLTEYDVYGRHVSRMLTAVGIPSEQLVDTPSEAEVATALLGPKADVSAVETGATARQVAAEGVRASFARRTGRDFGSVTDAEMLDGIEYFLFPNFMPWGGYLTSFAYTFRPNGNDPETSVMEIMVLEPLAEGAARPAPPPVRVLGPNETWADVPELGVFGRVFNQDSATFARVQRGLRASVQATTTLSLYQESRIRHLHATLEHYIDRGTTADREKRGS